MEMRTPACVLLISATALAAHDPSATVDPCKLVTAAEVQTVLGVAIVAPELTDSDPYRTAVTICGSWRGTSSRQTQARPTVGSGIGADAYTQRGGSGNLYVWKKGTELTINLEDQSGNTSPEKREEGQEKIAKIALSRM
jgi:hypothetical protein